MRKYIEKSSIDLIITSPPYNIKLKARNIYTKNYMDSLPEEAYRGKIKELIEELTRITKDDGSIWINMKSRYFNEGKVVTATYGSLEPPTWILNYTRGKLHLKNLVIWNYDINSDTKNNKFHPRYEFFFWFTKKVKDYKFYLDEVRVTPKTKDKRNNPKGANPTDVWYIPLVKGNSRERNFHPAQYPERLVERIMKACSEEYDTVLDPFLGSGTTMVVAKKLNRNCIGFEINSEYIKNTEKRLNLTQKNLVEFSTAKTQTQLEIIRK
ncbi:MAG: site-specific DNA-methyltransferase [Candidatus Helarchaeota archaeon]|nr:site-specific DNA-methyltransferase [Candidatus Helarchaeota archaeon]